MVPVGLRSVKDLNHRIFVLNSQLGSSQQAAHEVRALAYGSKTVGRARAPSRSLTYRSMSCSTRSSSSNRQSSIERLSWKH